MKAIGSSKAITKYLEGYAEPEVKLLPKSPWPHDFDHVLVIPAYQETRAFFDRLAQTLMQTRSVLLIVVINQPDTLDAPDPQNTALWKNITLATSATWCVEHLQLRSLPQTSSAVLLVNRFSQSAIPDKQGVGLARKIGADLGLDLIHRGLVAEPWIYSSDADVHLPEGYFSAINEADGLATPGLSIPDISTPGLSTSSKQVAAAVFPYQHICANDKVGQATQLYEHRLEQYVEGLRGAGSPYAYHTLGSALAIHASSYAMVRGFPKRNGGEDFYLLNKAAKTGSILNLDSPGILIEARESNRVPFGTGPAIMRLLSEDSLGKADIFYHPDVFIHLAQWLKAIPNTWTQSLAEQLLSGQTLQALTNLGADKAIANARQVSRSQQTYTKHMHTWFDGFRTLRFIHLLRDDGLYNVSIDSLSMDERPAIGV